MKQPATYRKEIAALRAKLPTAKTVGTLHAMRQRIRQLAAVMTTGKPGGWMDIPLEDACRITGEAPGEPPSAYGNDGWRRK